MKTITPWKCISIILKHRTYDFQFESFKDVSLFLFATRLIKINRTIPVYTEGQEEDDP